ncbi:MAG TPA: hypothetical protein VGC32_22060 [Solirubrobacterales bacterium]
MQRVKAWRPNTGTVLGLIAIAIAVVGTANAAPSKVVIRKGDIAPGAVTAKSIARGAVTAAKLRKGSVTAPKIVEGAVTSQALAGGSVTSAAIAPGSVYGGALGAETIVVKPITDLDKIPHNGEWTPSNTETALCGPGEALLGGGFAFMITGDGEVAAIEQMPLINAEVKGMQGRITSDSGGTATAQVAAICLK